MVRKQFGAKLKAKAALEAIKGEKTFAQTMRAFKDLTARACIISLVG